MAGVGPGAGSGGCAGFGYLGADAAQRVEGDQGVLEDETDPASPNAAPGTVVEGAQVRSVEGEAAGGDRGPAPGEAGQGPGGDALAGSGLADQGEAFAAVEVQGEVADGVQGAEGHVESVGVEEAHPSVLRV